MRQEWAISSPGLTASSVLEALQHWAAERPAHEAFGYLAQGERLEGSLSFGELDRRARALGARLTASGYRGERLLLVYPTGLAFIEAFFACLYAGAVGGAGDPPGARGRDRRGALAHDAPPAARQT
ncbi:MAG: AMP-binding protein, partial [Candidatus Sericytochromatia bacterium]